MNENTKLVLMAVLSIILITSGIIENVIEKFSSSLVPYILLIALFIFSYNWKFKKVNKGILSLAIFFSFIFIERLNVIALNIGSYIFGDIPLLGFLILYLFVYIILIDYIKYKTLLSRFYYFLVVILLFIFKDEASKLGVIISDRIPFLGFVILLLVAVIAFKDYKKHGRLIGRDYLLSVVVLILILRDRIQPLKWGSDFVLKILPGAGTNAVIVFLTLALFTQIIFYYLLWKRKPSIEGGFRL